MRRILDAGGGDGSGERGVNRGSQQGEMGGVVVGHTQMADGPNGLRRGVWSSQARPDTTRTRRTGRTRSDGGSGESVVS